MEDTEEEGIWYKNFKHEQSWNGNDHEGPDCDSFWEICQETFVTLITKAGWITSYASFLLFPLLFLQCLSCVWYRYKWILNTLLQVE